MSRYTGSAALVTIKMDSINLHVVIPTSSQMVAANFPYIHFKSTMGSLGIEVTVPSSDEHSIDLKFLNIPTHEYVKLFLEKYGTLDDSRDLTAEEKKKSWILHLNSLDDSNVLRQLMNVLLQIWVEKVYSNLKWQQCHDSTEQGSSHHVSEGTPTAPSSEIKVTPPIPESVEHTTPVVIPSDYIPGEGSWTNGD